MNTAQRQKGRGTALGEKGEQLGRHKWWHMEKAVYTQTLWVSNQTEAGKLAVGENEFCSLEALGEKERQTEKEK